MDQEDDGDGIGADCHCICLDRKFRDCRASFDGDLRGHGSAYCLRFEMFCLFVLSERELLLKGAAMESESSGKE